MAGGRFSCVLVIIDAEKRRPICPFLSFFRKVPLSVGQGLFPFSKSREGPGLTHERTAAQPPPVTELTLVTSCRGRVGFHLLKEWFSQGGVQAKLEFLKLRLTTESSQRCSGLLFKVHGSPGHSCSFPRAPNPQGLL